MNDGLAFPFAISLCIALIGVDTGVKIAPRAPLSDFFEVQSITAHRQGDTAVLDVRRTIHAPIHMRFNVRIFHVEDLGMVQTCSVTSSTILYMPGSVLPDPVTLDWWTWGECPKLPAGRAQIVTTWDPEPPSMESLTIITEVQG